jgi:hypothetical protein
VKRRGGKIKIIDNFSETIGRNRIDGLYLVKVRSRHRNQFTIDGI